MKKNLVIVALLCVVLVLVTVMWFKEDLKKDSVTMAPKPISQTSEAKTSAKVEGKKMTVAPIAPKSEVDQKLEKLGFGNSVDVHKITVR